MKSFSNLVSRFFLSAVLLSGLFTSCHPVDEYVAVSGFAQGGTYSVTVNLNTGNGRIRTTPQQLKANIDSILLQIDNSLSGYNKKSQLSDFNAGKPIHPSPLFLDIYRKSHEIYTRTEGVVDVAAGPLYDAWGFGFWKGELPDAETVDSLKAHSGMKLLHADMESRLLESGVLFPEAMLKDPSSLNHPRLNFNAVAQGYSCDIVAEYLHRLGAKDMMVDIGEIYCEGHNPKGVNWTIAIDTPEDNNNEPGRDICGVFHAPDQPCGIVTSGNYRKFYIRDGKKYAHTVDPRTGYPVNHNLLSATIIAKDAFTADAYATYCMVVGFEEAAAFITENPGLEGCLVYEEEGQMRTWISEGFNMH